jgi:hypothetical protein
MNFNHRRERTSEFIHKFTINSKMTHKRLFAIIHAICRSKSYFIKLSWFMTTNECNQAVWSNCNKMHCKETLLLLHFVATLFKHLSIFRSSLTFGFVKVTTSSKMKQVLSWQILFFPHLWKFHNVKLEYILFHKFSHTCLTWGTRRRRKKLMEWNFLKFMIFNIKKNDVL